MRVSTSMIFERGTLGLQNLQAAMLRAQDQMSTGRRILSPADDPIGMSEALKVSQSKGVNEQYMVNQATAVSKLSYTDSLLTSLGEQLATINEKSALAGGYASSPNQRGLIVVELKSRLEQVISIANSKDPTGLYVFSGYKTNTEPFRENTATTPATGWDLSVADQSSTKMIYDGDNGRPALEVSASRQMAVGESGLEVFMQVRDDQGKILGRSMFDSIQNMIDVLDPGNPAISDADYQEALNEIHQSITHVANMRASVGTRLSTLDSMTVAGEDVDYLYQVRLSELQDLDYTAAISDYTRFQMQLEAAQLTFKQTNQLSLFSIL